MSLIQKTSLLLSFVTFFLISILYFTVKLIVVSGFNDLEIQKLYDSNERALNSLNHEINVLAEKNLDWAYWNDTYDFMIDRNESYLENNIYPISTFSNINVNLCLFIDENGNLIKGFNTPIKEPLELPIPKDIQNMIEKRVPLFNQKDPESKSQGYLIINNQPMIIASFPVLNSEKEGPSRGTLVFGRFIDSLFISKLILNIKQNFSIEVLDGLKEEKFEDILTEYSKSKASVIQHFADTSLVYSVINDLNNKPILITILKSDRLIYQKGLKVQKYFLISLVIFSIIFIISVTLSLYFFVLKRISFLKNELTEIKTSGNLSKMIEVNGSDEVSDLVEEVNNLTNSLKVLQEELIKKSRETGIAQITSDILQNSGELLNRIKLSSKRIKVFIKNNDFKDLLRSVDMLLANREDPVSFFTEGKGHMLLEYLNKISSDFVTHKSNADLYQKSLEHTLDELEQLFDTYLPYTEKRTLFRDFPIGEAIEEAISGHYYVSNLNMNVTKTLNFYGTIHCDRAILVEIISNLLQNAAEAKRTGNDYQIEVVTEKLENNRIKISVKDNGIGIPEDQQIMIFNYRYSTKDKTKGVGLFNSANFAVDINGKLYIEESSKENGTKITLELPSEFYISDES